jgi:hypothetical protein
MNDTTVDLYRKYEKFMQVMLEDHTPLEVAAVMSIQALSLYKTFLSEEDFDKMVDSLVENKRRVKKLI